MSKLPRSPRAAARRRASIDRRLDAELFKALGDATRLTLLACLAKCGRPCTVGELSQCCAVDLSVVSRHLAQLERAGVLARVRAGRTVSYEVRYAEFAGRLRELADSLEGCSPPDPSSPDQGGCCGPA